MQLEATPQDKTLRKPSGLAWHEEIRFTLIGAAVGLLAVAFVAVVWLGNSSNVSWLRFSCPVTWQVIRGLLLPSPPLIVLFALIIGSFFEWTLWGVLIDCGRAIARRHSRRRRQSARALG